MCVAGLQELIEANGYTAGCKASKRLVRQGNDFVPRKRCSKVTDFCVVVHCHLLGTFNSSPVERRESKRIYFE